MHVLLAAISQGNFLIYLGCFAVAFALHEFEEWNIMRWYRRNYVDMPPTTDRAARTWIVFISGIGVIWCLVALASGDPRVAAWIFLPAVLLAVQNALQHVYWVFYFRQYAPGVITAALLLIPLGIYGTVQAVGQQYVPWWYVGALALLVVPGLIQTIKAGNRMTPLIRSIHHFSMKLAKMIWADVS